MTTKPFKFLTKRLLALIILLSSCNAEKINPVYSTDETQDPNILLIIADDFGLDACPNYLPSNMKPSMPNLINLMSNGIKFENLWSNAVCSPTRATILTGKYSFRTGVTRTSPKTTISNSEVSIFDVLKTSSKKYSTGLIGKWHLSNELSDPNNMGIDYFSGILGGGVPSYTNWSLAENGNVSNTTEYSTSKITDLSINWIKKQTKPWFLWVAYNAPHEPFHLPPSDLHRQGNLPTDPNSISLNPLPYYLAMVEAMDKEMGRMFNSIDDQTFEDTIIIFLGDNGTPSEVVQTYNTKRAKGSLYQGGINVPMVISGKGVSRKNEEDNNLLNTTDLFSTICDIAGAKCPERDDSKSFNKLLSGSFHDVRTFVYSEKYNEQRGGLDKAIRNESHKYILFGDGSEELYSLRNNPLEKPNLLNPSQLPLSETDYYNKTQLTDQLKKYVD